MARFFEKDQWLDIVKVENVATSGGFFPHPALYIPINVETEGIDGRKTDGGLISGTWVTGDIQYDTGKWGIAVSGSVNLHGDYEYYMRFSSTVDVDSGKGLVCMWYTPEYSYSASGGGDFVALGQSTRDWQAMTSTSDGNVYAAVRGGDIYMQTGGKGDFIALNQTSRNWRGITVSSHGNVYASVFGGDIYKQTGGSGNFVALNQDSRNWQGMTSTSNGNVYACVASGDIYMQTNGGGAFVALGQSHIGWRSMTTSPDGNVYSAVYGGDIYKQTGGSGNFVALNQDSRSWWGMAATPDGNVYAAVDSGDIYMQTGGSGSFIALNQDSRSWQAMTSTSDGNVYAAVRGGDIYINIQRNYLVESYGFLDLYYDNVNTRFIGRVFDGTSFLNKVVSGTSLEVISGTDYHIALGYDNSEGLFLHVNSLLDGVNNTTWTQQTLPTVVSFGCISGTGYPADGFIDDIRWYKRDITSAELTIIKNTDYSVN